MIMIQDIPYGNVLDVFHVSRWDSHDCACGFHDAASVPFGVILPCALPLTWLGKYHVTEYSFRHVDTQTMRYSY